MKRIVFLLVCMLFSIVAVNGKDKEEDTYRYEMEAFDGNAPAGRIIVKVWNYGKREKLTRQHCMRNAVHGILFKGVMGGGSTSFNKGRGPLVKEGYEAHKDFFDKFFDSGEYLKYVDLTNNGNIQPGDRIKISGKEFKVGMICIINEKALRDCLKEAGIKAGLDYLF